MFKVISYRESRVLPSKYSDTAIVRDRDPATDKIISSIFHEGTVPNIFPSELQVDLTRACSNKHLVNRYLQRRTNKKLPRDCLNCSFPHEDLTAKMPLDTFRTIIDRFSKHGGSFIFFTGGGEPGEYKDFMEAMEIVSEKGLGFGFNTNGAAILRLNRQPDERLMRIYQVSPEERHQHISWSVHDLEDLDMFKGMQVLINRFSRLGLNVLFRTSFLVHPETTEEEARDFLAKSKSFGASIATFKPAYFFDPESEHRAFGRNQRIHDIFRSLQIIFSTESFRVNFNRLDRLGEDFDPKFAPICFAPLEKVYVNVFGQVAMCCDRKDEGQGKNPTASIADNFPDDPNSYYISALRGMLHFRDWGNCIQGCNQHDFNVSAYEYVKSSPLFREYLELAELPEVQRQEGLSNLFK